MSDSLQSLGLQHTILQSLLKLVSIESVIYSNHLIFYSPLLLPSVFPSIRVFSLSKEQQQSDAVKFPFLIVGPFMCFSCS